jgi:hypothetical protein
LIGYENPECTRQRIYLIIFLSVRKSGEFFKKGSVPPTSLQAQISDTDLRSDPLSP